MTTVATAPPASRSSVVSPEPIAGALLRASAGVTLVRGAARARVWTGRVLTTLVTAFLLFDVTLKLLQPPMVVEGTARLGYPESSILVTAVLLLSCTLLHLIPRTAVLGAVLLTGYLGGAVATHLRVDDPLFSHIVFPVYVGALIWVGLVLRRPSLAPLLGLGRSVPV